MLIAITIILNNINVDIIEPTSARISPILGYSINYVSDSVSTPIKNTAKYFAPKLYSKFF